MSKYLGLVFLKKKHVASVRDKRGYVFGSLEDAIARFEAYEKISLAELVPGTHGTHGTLKPLIYIACAMCAM